MNYWLDNVLVQCTWYEEGWYILPCALGVYIALLWDCRFVGLMWLYSAQHNTDKDIVVATT